MARCDRTAFSLVEALAVLVLTALLLAGVLELLQQTTSTQRAARKLTEHNGQREVLAHALRADLANLVTHTPIARGLQGPGAAGEILEVICLAPQDLQAADQLARPWLPTRVRYKLDAGKENGGSVLTRQQEDLTQAAEAGKPVARTVAVGLEQMKVAFSQAGQWLDRWPPVGQDSALPQAVRITWQAKNGPVEQMVVDIR